MQSLPKERMMAVKPKKPPKSSFRNDSQNLKEALPPGWASCFLGAGQRIDSVAKSAHPRTSYVGNGITF